MPRKKKQPPPLSPLDELFATPVIPPEIAAADAAAREPRAMGSTINRVLQLVKELAIRRAEALALYEPLPSQMAFHQCRANERLMRGSVRGGKTLPCAVEVARALTAQDPYGKYPLADGVVYMVAPNEKHLADVIYPKLFKAGAFWMIKDLESGSWRSYRPWSESDRSRKRERKKVPPLIPHRFVKAVSWANKKRGVPDSVAFKTGWQINFFVEKGTPQRGADIDIAWVDEECNGWYTELSSRLLDREGKFIWSAAPQAGTQELYQCHNRAQEQLQRPEDKRTIVEFHIVLKENPHIDPQQKKELAEKLTEDEARILIDGEYAILSWLVFPMFRKETHGIRSFEIPHTWTHSAMIDPGHQVCAVLFVATPPPQDTEWGGHRIAYDELYLKQCDADRFGTEMAPKIQGKNFEYFIIDHRMGRQVETGGGLSIEMQYMQALQKRDLRCNSTGHQFIWGSGDVRGRLSSVRSWLGSHKDGKPIFLYFADVLKWLPWEFLGYHNKKTNKELTDIPVAKNDHLMACAQYGAAHGLEYVPPPEGIVAPSGALALFNKWQEEALRKSGGDYIRLGPGSAGA
jgi:hypothetical protein